MGDSLYDKCDIEMFGPKKNSEFKHAILKFEKPGSEILKYMKLNYQWLVVAYNLLRVKYI